MKRNIILVAFISCFTSNATAQLSVYSNGRVGISTSNTPVSNLSVRGGKEGYEAAALGAQRGIYGESQGHYLNWSYGLYGKSNCPTAGFQNGVTGIAIVPTPITTNRTYGVFGIAGNATSGWNYGVFGQLNGSNNGAGVYGTATNAENGTFVDGRYAGYFNGATKVNGNLSVTGYINGVILSGTGNSVATLSTMSSNNNGLTVADKLANLSTTCYFTELASHKTRSVEAATDSVTTIASKSNIETLAESRMHYGLDVESLQEYFPELVYTQDNGVIGINYIEMIPILIQAINTLKAEIKVLKANNSQPYSEGASTNTTIITLSSDGKIIGTKQSNSK